MKFLERANRPVYWALAGGLAIGAVAMATVMTGGVGEAIASDPVVHAQPVGSLSVEDTTALRSLDNAFASLAEEVEPTVVNIRSEGRGSNAFGQRMSMGGEGSGVVYRPDGWIMTNDHVAGGFDKVTVILDDGREFPGKVLRAPESDIAMIKIEATGLPTARFADSNKLRTGQFAIAFGSPFGLEKSMTVGHISGLSRQNSIPDARTAVIRTYGDMIQTDASINQGNSGGPLVNIDGEVIGVNTAIFSETGGSVGVGFAIPSNQAKLIADLLIEKGKVERGYLGVLPEDLKGFQKKDWNIESGAVVVEAPNTGPAAAGGVKENDVIVRVGTYPIKNQGDVRNSMLRYGPGQTVPVEVVRDGERKTLQVKLGTPPKPVAQTQRPRSGGTPLPDMPKGLEDFRKFFEGERNGPVESDVAPLREGQARLGVTVVDIDEASRKEHGVPAKVKGAIVTSVEPGSVAERLGVEPGDVIEKVGDVTVSGAADVSKAMDGVKWGDQRSIKIGRYSGNTTLVKTVDARFR